MGANTFRCEYKEHDSCSTIAVTTGLEMFGLVAIVYYPYHIP
jgi:hypothetical protein